MRDVLSMLLLGPTVCLLGCEGKNHIHAIALAVSMTTEDAECVEGWTDANEDGLCGVDDLSYQWIGPDDETMRYVHPEVIDGELQATLIIETFSLENIDCKGEPRDHESLYTSHFWLTLVQENQAQLPEDTAPVVSWTVETVSMEDPDGHVIINNFTPQPISSYPPDLCVNLLEEAGVYMGGGGFHLNLGLEPL